MPPAPNPNLLEALLDSWDRNNQTLLNLVELIPPERLSARVLDESPTVAGLLTHIHFVRLVLVSEDAPDCAVPLPTNEWQPEADPARIANMLRASSAVVRAALASRIATNHALDRHYDHPLLFLQHMIWHEGYHHGQIKLALKAVGHPLPDHQAGPLTWGVWMRKRRGTT